MFHIETLKDRSTFFKKSVLTQYAHFHKYTRRIFACYNSSSCSYWHPQSTHDRLLKLYVNHLALFSLFFLKIIFRIGLFSEEADRKKGVSLLFVCQSYSSRSKEERELRDQAGETVIGY